MTENEFYRKALLQLAANPVFKPNYYLNGKTALREWAEELGRAAGELLEVAASENCGVDDTEDVLRIAIESDSGKPQQTT